MTEALVEASRQAIDLPVRLLATTAPGDKRYKTDRDFATDADLLIEREVRTRLEKLTP